MADAKTADPKLKRTLSLPMMILYGHGVPGTTSTPRVSRAWHDCIRINLLKRSTD